MLCLNISDVVINTVKGVDYHCIICDTSKSEAIYLSENLIVGIYKMHIKKSNIKNRVYN